MIFQQFRFPGASMLVLAACLLACGQNKVAQAFPEPELTSSEWEFDFRQAPIRTIAVKRPIGGYEWFWFITYSVENRTKVTQNFAPDFTVMTDSGKVIKPNHGIDNSAFNAIKKRVGNNLLESPVAVRGNFLPGRDHIKESVIVWRVPTEHVSRMTLFIGGLSGEVQRMTMGRKLKVTSKGGETLFDGPLVYSTQRKKLHRAFDRKVKWMDLSVAKLKAMKGNEKIIVGNGKNGRVSVQEDRWVVTYQDHEHDIELLQLKKGREEILRKQLMIDFELPGRAPSPQTQTVVQTAKNWVMR